MKPATSFGRGLALVIFFSAPPTALTDTPSQALHNTHFADAYDQAAIVGGRMIYMHACARCHGHSLQGQPLWQMDDASRRRAPAQDDTGHTWQHSDEAIFQMVKRGRFSDTRQDVGTSMPAFGARLSDKEILDVISFIKARWSIGLRAAQATLNPGMAGMPSEANRVEWTLPPICAATQRQWRATSK